MSWGQVGINTNNPHPSAILDISQNPDKGMLAPRIALQGERDLTTIPNPKKGLLVFNTTHNESVQLGYYYFNNEKWEPFFSKPIF